METKNKTALVALIFLLVGILVGYLSWGLSKGYKNMGMHQMPDGKMMHDMENDSHDNMTMRTMMKDMTASLEDKTGVDFDEAFIMEMIPHHQGAIEMARMVLASSKNPELIKLANDIISAQQKEIDMMRGWQREWFGVQAQ